jgi:hypothetical protein
MPNILNCPKPEKWDYSAYYSRHQAIGGTKDICKFYAFQDRFPEDLIDAVDKCKTNKCKTSGDRMGYSAITRIKSAGVPFCIIIRWVNQKISVKL